jgi:hypothetical protein
MREIPREGGNQAFLLKALHEAGGELEEEFYGLRPAQLAWHREGEWSLIQIAGHLRDNEQQTLAYLRAIAANEAPALEVVDLEGQADESCYEPLDLHDLLYGFAGLRQELLYLLYRLPPEAWQRGGEHPYRGTLTIAQLVRELNEHDLGHLWQIQKIKEAMG